jgi:hypothetical protein
LRQQGAFHGGGTNLFHLHEQPPLLRSRRTAI